MDRDGFRFPSSRAVLSGGLFLTIVVGIALVGIPGQWPGPDAVPRRMRLAEPAASPRVKPRKGPAARLRFSPVRVAPAGEGPNAGGGVQASALASPYENVPPAVPAAAVAPAQADADAAPRPAAPQPTTPQGHPVPVIGEYTFRFDSALREQLDALGAEASVGGRIQFPVSESRVVDLQITRHDTRGETRGDVIAKVDDQPLADAVLSYVDEAVAGTIVTAEGELFQVRYAGQGVHRVVQLDPNRMPPEAEPIVPPAAVMAAGQGQANQAATSRAMMAAADRLAGAQMGSPDGSEPPMAADTMMPGVTVATDGPMAPPPVAGDVARDGDTAIINMLVVYTSQSRINNGGTSGMEALIAAAVAKSNLAYRNSGIDMTMKVAASVESSYVSSGSLGTDLGRLQNATDGYLDAHYSDRVAFQADMITLLVPAPGDGTAGIAYLLNPATGMNNHDWVMSVVGDVYADGNITLAHEVGHNFGCGHGNGDGGGIFASSQGWRFTSGGTQYRTVMAYAPGIRIPYFSNPNVAYGGVATGTASANNAATLNQGRKYHARLEMSPSDSGVAAAADFNANGHPDLILRNVYNGNVDLVPMLNYMPFAGATFFSGYPEWEPRLAADFNGDAKPDIVWRNTTTGLVNVALMDGLSKLSSVVLLPANPNDRLWVPMLAADFNGDNNLDIMWQHASTGKVVVWFMSGTARQSQMTFWDPNDTSWAPLLAGDFNADAKPDVIWRHAPTGRVTVNFMNGLTKTGAVDLLQGINYYAESIWRPVAAADFTGDGKPDIVWRNTSTGEISLWEMDGTTRTARMLIYQ